MRSPDAIRERPNPRLPDYIRATQTVWRLPPSRQREPLMRLRGIRHILGRQGLPVRSGLCREAGPGACWAWLQMRLTGHAAATLWLHWQ